MNESRVIAKSIFAKGKFPASLGQEVLRINMMKPLVILILMFAMSCDQNGQTHIDNMHKIDKANHAMELIDHDFLKYTDSSKFDYFKVQLIDSFDIYNENNFKIAHIDAEELAEFSFDFFLPSINKILAKRDFKLSVQKLNNNENSHEILINGNIVQLYTQNDMHDNTFWNKASRNFFRKINQLLKSENCDEQFYLLYEGNDLQTMLLTDKQFLIILDFYKDIEEEKPYKP